MKVAYNFEQSNETNTQSANENQEIAATDANSSGTVAEIKGTHTEPNNGATENYGTSIGENSTQEELTRTESIENGTSEEPVDQSLELSDETLVSYLNKKNGTKFLTLEEYQNSFTKEITKEVVKSPNYDEETAAFFQFKKETGGSFKEWVSLNENLDDKTDLEVAIDKVKIDNKGLALSDAQATLLLAEELGVDIEDFETLSEKEKLKLSIISNKHRQTLRAEQEKYRQPIKEVSSTNEESLNEEQVMVAGQKMDKTAYEHERKVYLSDREKAVQGIENYNFSVELEGMNGDMSQLDFSYTLQEEDKQSMLSVTESVDNILPNFFDDKGQFNHRAFNESIGFWADENLRAKAIQSISQQAFAAGVNSALKQERNIDFSNPPQPSVSNKVPEGYGEVGIPQYDGVSVKYKFNG